MDGTFSARYCYSSELIVGRDLPWLWEKAQNTADDSRVSCESGRRLWRSSRLWQQFASFQRNDRPLGGGAEEARRETQPVQQTTHLVGDDELGWCVATTRKRWITSTSEIGTSTRSWVATTTVSPRIRERIWSEEQDCELFEKQSRKGYDRIASLESVARTMVFSVVKGRVV